MIYEDSDGCIVVDGDAYASKSQAYLAARKLYNKSIGRESNGRLGGTRIRKSVISHSGMDFEPEYTKRLNEEFGQTKKVRCYILGLIGISYCYLYGEWDFDPAFREYDNDKRERYIDWLMCRGGSAIRMCGRIDTLEISRIGGTIYGRYVKSKKLRLKQKNKWKKKNTMNSQRG